MDKSLFFWLVYIVCVVVSGLLGWPFTRSSGVWLVVLLLIGVLGWAVFGQPVR
jgi:hypothetical protein